MFIRILIKLLGGWWRLKHECCKARAGSLRQHVCLFLYRWYQSAHGASIEWTAKFENEPCLPHGIYGVFVSGEARIGHDCVIFHQVTIGSNYLPDSKGAGCPVIGNACYIGVGAKIIGNVRIGNNVRIGANTTIYRDVPDNSVVVSNEQKAYVKEGMNNSYYSFRGRWVKFVDGEWVPVTDATVLAILKLG